MAAAVKGFYDITLSWWGIGTVSTFGAVFFGCVVYIAAMIAIGGIGERDMEQVPMLGRPSIKFLRRIGVFK